MERYGYPEETYYTFSYTPIPVDEGQTAGMICANTDDTDRIISERDLKTLTQLGTNLTDCTSGNDIIKKAIDTLKENPQDFPFDIFRMISDNKAIIAYSTELGDSDDIIPLDVSLDEPNEIANFLREAIVTRKLQIFDDVRGKIGMMPKGPWQVAPHIAIVLPIISKGVKKPYGLLIIGVNP